MKKIDGIPEDMPRANIWYISPYAGGPGIGRGGRVYYLARNWIEQSIQATIFCPTYHHIMDEAQEAGPTLVDGVRYHFIAAPTYHGNGLKRLANMTDFSLSLLRNSDRFAESYGRPDVIITSSPHPYAFLASDRIARKYGARSIFEVRDLWPQSMIELAGLHPFHPMAFLTGWVEKFAYKRADHIVSLLPKTFDYMRFRGVSRDRWHYIPNGVLLEEKPEIDSSEPAYQQLRAWQGEGKFVILYAGALGPPNNMDLLVEAADILKSEGDDRIRFLIVGRGETKDELIHMVSNLQLDDRIKFYPQVPKRHAIGLMQQADAGHMSLCPQPIYRYGISLNKLFDYMLAELPIVAAMEAGNDPVGDAGCGIVIKPGMPGLLAKAYSDMASSNRDELREMGARGRAYVLEHHNYSKLSRQYADLFG